MAGARKISTAKNSRAGFADSAVDAAFAAYPKPIKAKLLTLRRLILDTASKTTGVGALEETPKWGQPSYLTTSTKSGSTIRIDREIERKPGRAVFSLPDRSGGDVPRAVSERADL
jgi:hypothetical protein